MNRLALPKLPGWLAAVLWMSVIFILSALPGTTVDEVSGGVLWALPQEIAQNDILRCRQQSPAAPDAFP